MTMVTANPAALDVLTELNPGAMRQLIPPTNGPWQDAVDAVAPGIGYLGMMYKPGDDETTIRGNVTALAAQNRSAYCVSMHGPNEPNSDDGGTTTWPTRTVKEFYWMTDQANTVSWTHRAGGTPPRFVSPALKHNVSGTHGLDDQIAALAAATYNPGSGALSLFDLLHNAGGEEGGIDFHNYQGVQGPGFRVNGQDSYGDVPAGLTPSAVDGKCSLLAFEAARHGQMAPGIAVTDWTEFGWTRGDASPSQTVRASFAVESMLRGYLLGIRPAIYELIDEFNFYTGGSGPTEREDLFGLYSITDTPTGPYPPFAALKSLWNDYAGTDPFTDVGWFEPVSGNNPDQGWVILPKTGGGWTVHILWEARTSTDLVLAPGHHVVGRTRTSKDSFANKHYTISAGGDTMTVLSVA